MNLLDANIGSAKDNMRCSIHNWYKFTAGFSYKFVDLIVDDMPHKPMCIYEPFAGCGTTLVEAQKKCIKSIGNESQLLMCDIINAKLNWDIDSTKHLQCMDLFEKNLVDFDEINTETLGYHDLLKGLYDHKSLRELYLLRDSIRLLQDEKFKLFYNLVLSQVLHKAAIHPIAIPYISRSKKQTNAGDVWKKFKNISAQMLADLEIMPHKKRYAEVFHMDSRKQNKLVDSESCDLCITSPPYLNNLDYGEVSKVHTHFFQITKDWHDITEKVRQNLVTGATTHYKDAEFDMNRFMNTEFVLENKRLYNELTTLFSAISRNSKERSGKKSFHILMMHYFEDMFYVLKEMYRVLSVGSKAYLILGDSAPYGVYIPTTQLLGGIAQSVGFGDFAIYKIRERGNKWKSLKNRHNIQLSENILVLTK